MPEKEFQTFVQTYRIEQETAAVERRAVASALAAATSQRQGVTATWGKIAAVTVGGIAAVSALIGIVVVLVSSLSGQ